MHLVYGSSGWKYIEGKILHSIMASITTQNGIEIYRDLLLGGGGRLGRMLRHHWPQGSQLCAQSRQNGGGMVVLDPLREPDALRNISKGRRAIICLSGVTPAHAAETGDAMSLNTDLALAALDAAPPDARVFVVSSAAVYGAAEGPHLEADSVTPASEYGHAKRAMEIAALAQGAGRVCVLRIGNVAGADAILGGWRAGMLLDQLPDGGTPRRSYIGPRTLAQAIHSLCAAEHVPEIVNIAAPGVIEMGALLDSAGLAWAPRKPVGPVIEEVMLDTGVLERFYTFVPQECSAAGMIAQWQEGTRP